MVNKNLNDLPNEALDAWAAEFLGMVKGTGHGLLRNLLKDRQGRSWDWCPTAEGKEDQAMMVARKMGKADKAVQWAFLGALQNGPPHGADETLRRLLWGETFGSAIILAALKAKGVEERSGP